MLLTPQQAAQEIAGGAVVAYPTEAVYGLGCDPNNVGALQQILTLKERDKSKGFILIASQQVQLKPYMAALSNEQQSQLDHAWPGPVTFVVTAKPDVPNLLTGGRDTLAVRVSSHPVVVALCDACQHPLVSTSANLSGQEAFRDATLVLDAFGDKIAGVVDGALGDLAAATPIHSLITGKRLR